MSAPTDSAPWSGGRTLRFTWEQMMFRPEWVLEQVQLAIAAAIGEGKAA